MSEFVRATLRKLIGFFITGVLAVLPLVLTVGIVIWVAGFIEQMIGPNTFLGTRLRNLGLMVADDTVIAYVVGWIIVLALIFVIGILISLGAQQLWERITNAIIRRLPVVGGVYQTAEQLVDMLKKKDPSELQGMSVVFCTFGEGGTGVLALMPSPERFEIDGTEYNVVIIPTAPVPVGGALLFIPANQVKPSSVSVDGLMSIYISMGVTVPKYISDSYAKKK